MDVKSIDDTSNFDEFPDVDLKIRKLAPNKYFRTTYNICIIFFVFLKHGGFVFDN